MSAHMPPLPQRFLSAVEKCDLPPAVVLGTGNTGLSIARALRSHGIPVLGVDGEHVSYTGHSSAFDLIRVPEFFEPHVVRRLASIAESLPRKPVLFCSGDEHVALLSRHGGELHERYHFELPAAADVEVLANKHRFAEVAVQRGWPVPMTYRCESLAELEKLIGVIQFPVILKPEVKNRETRAHSPLKAFRCETAAQLRTDYQLLAQWEKEVVIQQWIPGGDDEIYFSFHYFDANLRELAHFEGKKIRQYVPLSGSTSLAVGVEASHVTDLSREILTAMRSVGFCSVEYKRDPRDGRYYIMEPTVGRPNLQVGVAIANGVDIVSRAYFHLIDRPLPPPPSRTHHVKWLLWPEDWWSARWYMARSELTWRDYLRSVSGPKVVAPFTWDDYRLAGAYLSNFGGRVLGWGRRKLRRGGRGRQERVPQRASSDAR
jgi:D-aspartate ligase